MSFGNEREFIDHLQTKEKERQAMKCPVLYAIYLGMRGVIPDFQGDCFQEECAWWHKDNETCAVLTLAQGSVFTHKALILIAKELTLVRPPGK